MVDPWISLIVKWGVENFGDLLHLLVRDPAQGYLELQVDPESGALVALILLNEPEEIGRAVDDVAQIRDFESPVLDLSIWPWKATPDYKEPAEFNV